MEQAGDARHHLQRWLKEQGFAAAAARTQHLVVLPHTDTTSYDAHDFRRTQVVDTTTMKQLGARVLDAINAGDGHAPLTSDALEELAVRLMPVMTTDGDVSEAAELEEAGDRLAADLAERVAEWRYFDRLKVVGGAGTGKTWLAMAQARRLAKQGKRVALVCYSRGLAAFLERESASWKPRPAYVGRFHGLGQVWGGPELNEQGASGYWEDELPRALGELAATVPAEQRFDAVVVDEGQDFGAHWWTSLEQCLRSPGLGGLYVFLDGDQRVFPRQGEVPISTPPIVLGRNLRNTPRIAGTFSSLVSEDVTAKGMKGPRVRFVQCGADDAVTRADDAVAELVDTWEPGQLALLTTCHRHPVHVEVVDGPRGWPGYWDDYFAGDSVCYGTVGGFKGLERSCVVLAVNGFSSEARAKEMLYVGLSRARSQLVVVGDLEEIAKAGGEGVRKRLMEAEEWDPPPA
jgi:ATP:corrinoid adenosyltransferase